MKLKHLIAYIFALNILTGLSQTEQNGYFFQYHNPSVINYSNLTDIVFCNINGDNEGNLITGNYSTNTISGFDFNKFVNVRDDAKNNLVNLWLGVGGIDHTGLLLPVFNEIAGNTTKLNKFTTDLVAFSITHEIHGLVIQFHLESATDTDRKNNVLVFLDSLSSKIKLSSHPNLKIALNVKGDYSQNQGTDLIHPDLLTSKSDLIDLWHISTFEFPASFSVHHSTVDNTIASAKYWNEKGVPFGKMDIGISFESWSEDRSTFKYYNEFTGSKTTNYESDSYQNFYYNGRASILDKSNFALNKELHGVFLWNLSADRDHNDYSLLDALEESRIDFCQFTPVLGEDKFISASQSIVLNSEISGNGTSFTWTHNGDTLQGENDSAITINTPGTFVVTANYPNACSTSSSVDVSVISSTHGLKESKLASIINTSDFIEVNSITNGTLSMRIVNLEGKTVKNFNFSKSITIPTESLPAGLYFIQISTENEFQTKKILKR